MKLVAVAAAVFPRPTVIAAILGFAAAAAAVVLGLSLDRDEPGDLPPPPVAGALPSPPPNRDRILPAIDVLRVGGGGDAMIAGRALPGAPVRVRDAGRGTDLGRAVADPRGEWVVVPDLPLGAGIRLLAPVSGDGAAEAVGEPVAVLGGGTATAGALAVRLARAGGSRLLPLSPAAAAAVLEVVVADRDPNGRLTVGGRAAAGETIHVYVDNRFVGRTRAGSDGAWRLTARAPHHGSHALRADQVDGRGKVLLRVERDWDAGDDMVPARTDFSVKAEGDAWRIAWRAGGGTLYTVVWPEADRDRRDPDMLYPGQVVSAPVP